jgi:hypothetical protein
VKVIPLKKRWSILTLVMLLGFGIILKSRWDEVARVEAANHKLETRIAVSWRKTVTKREAASHAVAARKERFQLRKLAAVYIDAQAEGRDRDAKKMAIQNEKLSKLSLPELAEVIDQLQASSFPDDTRKGIESMLAAVLIARCADEPGHDALIHRFLMRSPVALGPEITRPLIALIGDSRLRTEVAHRLANPAPP